MNKTLESIDKYLSSSPTKEELAESLYLIKTCLSKTVTTAIFDKSSVYDELEGLTNNIMPKFFRNIYYPRWLYESVGCISTYGGESDFESYKENATEVVSGLFICTEVAANPKNHSNDNAVEITPNFDPDITFEIEPLDIDGNPSVKFIDHFIFNAEMLPSREDISKLSQAKAYSFITSIVDNVPTIYLEKKFPIFAAAQKHKAVLRISEHEDFIFCAKLVFMQVLISWLYCYRHELEQAKDYYRESATKHYPKVRMEQLENDLVSIRGVKNQLKKFGLVRSFRKTHLNGVLKELDLFKLEIEQDLKWYTLFQRIGDKYFETRAIYTMIDNLLEHGFKDADVIDIVKNLTDLLRDEPDYGKLLRDKMEIFMKWKKDFESSFGLDPYQRKQSEYQAFFASDDAQKTVELFRKGLLSLEQSDEDIFYPTYNPDDEQ